MKIHEVEKKPVEAEQAALTEDVRALALRFIIAAIQLDELAEKWYPTNAAFKRSKVEWQTIQQIIAAGAEDSTLAAKVKTWASHQQRIEHGQTAT